MTQPPTKALTVWQPWATALVEGVKTVENRRWAPRWPEGVPLTVAIHAAAREPSALDLRIMRWLWPEMVDDAERAGRRVIEQMFPTSALVGVVRFSAFVRLDSSAGRAFQDDPWATGPRLWVVGAASRLAEPIPMAGSRGLWRLPELVGRRLQEVCCDNA